MITSVCNEPGHLVLGRSNLIGQANKRSSSEGFRFTLVIPALNEEEALASTLERALAVRGHVIKRTVVTEMNVVLVNDGSTDSTQAIADKYPEIIKIQFERNRGYGAAIKAGFHATDANLVGFMDADGTCDPAFCVYLINTILAEDADVAIGSRMSADSEMPLIRRFGNLVFARLIGTVSGQELTDCASGMRVLRRSSLRQLHPLPDGLHFTPAMTCLALFNPRLKITEVPMPYKRRVGHSKLRVVEDGLKFLFTILFTAALFNPIKALISFGALFLLFGLATCAVGAGLGASLPVLLAWGGAFVIVMIQAVFIGFLSHQALHLLLGPWRLSGFGESMLQRYVYAKRMIRSAIFVFALGLAGFAAHYILAPPWNTMVAIAGALAVVLAGWTALAGVILRVIWTASERRNAEREDPFAITAK